MPLLMTVSDAGDIAILPFAFTDTAATRPRPALALSPRGTNKQTGGTALAMITTPRRSQWASEVAR
jgi:mRNA-degrading endonuclease toxin of MazEF toxin-antitoxin module